MGGTTYSNTMTENNSPNQCVDGCAVVASWSTLEGKFFDRWVFTKFNGVLALSSQWVEYDGYNSDLYRGTTAILFTRDMPAGEKY